MFAQEKDQMPAAFSCLIHIYSQRDRKKKKASQPSHSSEFTVQKGSQKDNNDNNQCKIRPALEDWFSTEGYEKSDRKHN